MLLLCSGVCDKFYGPDRCSRIAFNLRQTKLKDTEYMLGMPDSCYVNAPTRIHRENMLNVKKLQNNMCNTTVFT